MQILQTSTVQGSKQPAKKAGMEQSLKKEWSVQAWHISSISSFFLETVGLHREDLCDKIGV